MAQQLENGQSMVVMQDRIGFPSMCTVQGDPRCAGDDRHEIRMRYGAVRRPQQRDAGRYLEARHELDDESPFAAFARDW